MEKLGLDFSLLIAYLLPGALTVVALSFKSTTIEQLLKGDNGSPAVGALIPILTLALGLGIIVNAISWVVIRRLIEATGVKKVQIKGCPTKDSLELYRFIIDNSFRYYQCYSNMFTALLILGAAYLNMYGCAGLGMEPIVVLAVLVVLFLAARDSLERTYSRIGTWMNSTEGNNHDERRTSRKEATPGPSGKA